MASPIQEHLEKTNKEYASNFTQGHLALPPAKKYLILTCMDARIDPASAFGITLGDAHVIRNAGASARDALRSLIISQQLLGTREIILIKHTGCGMSTFKDEDAHAVVKKNVGDEAAKSIEDLKFLAFPDLEQGVRDDLEFLKRHAAIPEEITLSGWVYEVESGKVRRVE
ncbi:carbonate dehydratase [Tothia fuscella]|uniref:Carbonic anhydrase n=1 Tax=Tothia fuscella TaxID=1048955 RepID=A0A9P4NR53_9PEZI|nr:carbonate dehydratase [Tothia fuscella]